MEYTIDIQVRREDLDKLDLQEKTIWWNGKEILDSPRCFFLAENVTLIETSCCAESNQDIELFVKTGVSELIYLANTDSEMIKDNVLFNLLEKICCLDHFSIIIRDVDEKVKKNIELVQGSEITSGRR